MRGESITRKPASGLHKYTVIQRHEDDDGILIRIEYSVER
jgi:hypothetical protein